MIKMIKCPNCGSTAQPRVIEVEFEEEGCEVIRYLTYKCGCGQKFLTKTYFKAATNELISDPNV